MAEEKKGFKFPSAYTILFILIIIVAIGVVLLRSVEQDLHPHADAEQGNVEVDQRPPQTGCVDPVHHCLRRSDARQHDRVGSEQVGGFRGHDDVCACARQALTDRNQVAGPVIDDGDRRSHVDPLVDATPIRRSSAATAERSARASALKAASAM